MSEKPLVVLTHPLPEDWIAPLRAQVRLVVGPEGVAGVHPSLEPYLAEAEGLLTWLIDRVDEALLARMPRLRVVSNMAVGVDNIDLEACRRRGIPVGHTPEVLTDAVADLTLALLLAVARGIFPAAQDAREGRWGLWSPTRWLGADLQGATLGIVGLGGIGQAVARRAVGFGLRIGYTSRTPKPEAEAAYGAQRLPLDELLAMSDFVSLHVPLTPETRGLIGEAALRRMKPTAYLINMARGPVVDTDALVRALQEGWIAGAALDVTEPEPLPPAHPLYRLPNCVIVPHIGSATHATRRRMAELACANLLAGLRGEPLPHRAN
ncbi:MAG TPA: D-glycerate dehydrogenase [Anaerolineales bacterium]|nr:D-glycerate dehydrogenase [Anaerolineales bacterium]